ncbi:MinD/ParA family protein [Cytobacillus sp. FJAT-54145]|uniref:MinD/ParA family protein n=1 Tax=Cytobacillus spartinae TaxID=3299023 RepID=A0ABW6K4L4_9BACI
MNDQAEALRNKISNIEKDSTPKTIAVVSGKGGVGKSNFSLNFAISLSKRGQKVLLFDMDVGMGNIDILMGRTTKSTIVDFFKGDKSLKDVVMEGPDNIRYIAGGSGLSQLIKLDEELVEFFSNELSKLINDYDYIIFDMGAGVSEESLNFILAVDEIVVITTPEPTSITDAYAMMKYIHLNNQDLPILIMVNRVQSEKEGKETFNRLKMVLKRFLDRDVILLGTLPDDKAIHQSVVKQVPFINNEKSNASKALYKITERYEKQSFNTLPPSNHFLFVSKLKQFLFER